MVYSVQQIKHDILAYIKEFGGDFGEWYVGIAADPLEALFKIHRLDKAKDPWIYKQALSFNAARTVQQYFLTRLHTSGDAVTEASEDTDCVYAYKKKEPVRHMVYRKSGSSA